MIGKQMCRTAQRPCFVALHVQLHEEQWWHLSRGSGVLGALLGRCCSVGARGPLGERVAERQHVIQCDQLHDGCGLRNREQSPQNRTTVVATGNFGPGALTDIGEAGSVETESSCERRGRVASCVQSTRVVVEQHRARHHLHVIRNRLEGEHRMTERQPEQGELAYVGATIHHEARARRGALVHRRNATPKEVDHVLIPHPSMANVLADVAILLGLPHAHFDRWQPIKSEAGLYEAATRLLATNLVL
mmetsp:Transcript_26342/g.66241  ORF Transcript_26342/g.66241 Transcript_26342/m.66241 type:complete len:247 (+) Transcript_26342:266-1006(+)